MASTPSLTNPPESTQLTAQTNATADMSADKPKAKRSSRAGVPNYNSDDIDALLNLAEEIEPLGANHWSIVANRFAEWADSNDRPHREYDSLRNKFDKLANAKKKTGDPSCPPIVRRAKHIARAIQNKCAAMTLGDSDEEEVLDLSSSGDGEAQRSTPQHTQEESDVLGARTKRRKTAGTGQARTKVRAEDALLEHVGDIAGHIGKLSNTIAEGFGIEQIHKQELAKMIRDEVREMYRPTQDLLKEMQEILTRIDSDKEKDS